MKKDILYFNENFKPITPNYFKSYGGGPYSENYLKYTVDPKRIIRDLYYNDIPFQTLLDVGCASGQLVRDFRQLGIDAFGIENNREILKKCIAPKYCTFGDMLDLSEIASESFEILYCNALMYAWPSEILNILKSFHRIVTKAVYFCCPFLDTTLDLNNDPYRYFLAKETWWEKQFKEAGFFKVNPSIYSKSEL